MARLSLSLLGPFQAALDGEPIGSFKTDKVRALLAYLAVEADRPHRRETLCGLLWPESTDDSARASLRNALSLLRRAIRDRDASPPHLLVERGTIQFHVESDYWLDVAAFCDALAASRAHPHEELDRCTACMERLSEAVALYQGEFLDGFSVDSTPLEEWLVVRREALHLQVLEALDHLALYYEAMGAYGRMLEAARRQVALEPWRERAHRQWMRALALSGQRGAALAQYEACRQVLDEELGIAPEAATTQLYGQIRSGDLTPQRDKSRIAPSPAPQAEAEARPPMPSEAEPEPELGTSSDERRIATVLSAELVGAAALGKMDAEAWAETVRHGLQHLSAEVARYGGTVAQIRSTGLVACFGVPLVHEDDAERAVLAGLGMQEAVAQGTFVPGAGQDVPLSVCVGIHTGEMIRAAATTRDAPAEQAALGPALALAERVAQRARAGAVWVTERTYRLVRTLFQWQALGEIALQGVSDSLPVYRPMAHVAQADRGRASLALSSPLVGRQGEMQALQRAVAYARAAIGGIVTIVGEPGIGKSRLVAEVRKGTLAKVAHQNVLEPSQGRDLQWIEGRCLSYGGTVAYHLWLDLLRSLLGIEVDASQSVLREALRTQVQTLCPDEFGAVYPSLAALLSLPLEADTQAALRGVDAEGRRTLTFRAIVRLLEASAVQQPLIAVCEDLHWADPTSLALLEEAFALTDRVPLTFVCTLRPETEEPCWRIRELAAREYHHRHTDLWLQPLEEHDGWELLDGLLRSAPVEGYRIPVDAFPEQLRANVLNRGAGNPFYVTEILRSLIERGALVRDQESATWQFTQDTAEITMPGTLYGVLVSRIDRLPRAARHVLQLAAVIGPTFAYPLLAAISGSARLEEHLVALQRAEMIREQASRPERTYAFLHQLTQEATYGTLLRSARRVLHRRVAEALEQLSARHVDEQLDLLAYHWEQAGDVEHAVAYLCRAGDQATAQYANPEAVEYYTRALRLLPQEDVERRFALLLARERVYDLQGARDEQAHDLLALADLAEDLGDARRRAEVTVRRAHHAVRADEHHVAIRYAQAAVRFARQAGDVGLEAAACLKLGEAQRMAEHRTGARQQLKRALRLAQEARLLTVEADAWRELGLAAYWWNDLTAAKAHYAQALRADRESGDRMHEGRTLNSLAAVTMFEGDLGKAETYVQQGLALCRATGNRRDEAYALLTLACVREAEGDYAVAQAHNERALALFRAVGDSFAEAIVMAHEALIQHQLGDDVSALLRCKDALRLADAGHEGEGQREALVYLGHALSALARPDQAADAYRRAVALYEKSGLPHRTIEAHAGLAEIYLAQDDLSTALLAVESVLAHTSPRSTYRNPAAAAQVPLTCYRVLRAAGDPRADELLSRAYHQLQERAATIEDPALRRSFLENVPAHRDLIAAFEQR